jgi:hypothetical protein
MSRIPATLSKLFVLINLIQELNKVSAGINIPSYVFNPPRKKHDNIIIVLYHGS